jgi:hypothetical protein
MRLGFAPVAGKRDSAGRGERLRAAEEENSRLRAALDVRIAVDRATGILAERYQLGIEQASVLLHASAERAGMEPERLAKLVLLRGRSPAEVEATLADLWQSPACDLDEELAQRVHQQLAGPGDDEEQLP